MNNPFFDNAAKYPLNHLVCSEWNLNDNHELLRIVSEPIIEIYNDEAVQNMINDLESIINKLSSSDKSYSEFDETVIYAEDFISRHS